MPPKNLPSPDLLRLLSDSSRLSVRVVPNSRRTEILSFKNGILKVAVKAPPENNRANLELVKFLSKLVGRKVSLVSGASSKNKILSLN